MSYFRELPNFEYQSPFANSTGASDYVTAKNVFRRMKLRDDLKNVFTLFNKRFIEEGERPDTVAEKEYGKSDLDWVVLLSAGIINVRNEWPLSSRDLYNFTVEKYGLAEKDFVHHYETEEVKDSQNRLILPKGKIVDSNFTIPKPGEPNATINPVVGISNYEYETRINDEKRNIFVLREEYLQQFLNDMRELMTYDESSEFIDERTAQTENTNITLP